MKAAWIFIPNFKFHLLEKIILISVSIVIILSCYLVSYVSAGPIQDSERILDNWAPDLSSTIDIKLAYLYILQQRKKSGIREPLNYDRFVEDRKIPQSPSMMPAFRISDPEHQDVVAREIGEIQATLKSILDMTFIENLPDLQADIARTDFIRKLYVYYRLVLSSRPIDDKTTFIFEQEFPKQLADTDVLQKELRETPHPKEFVLSLFRLLIDHYKNLKAFKKLYERWIAKLSKALILFSEPSSTFLQSEDVVEQARALGSFYAGIKDHALLKDIPEDEFIILGRDFETPASDPQCHELRAQRAASYIEFHPISRLIAYYLVPESLRASIFEENTVFYRVGQANQNFGVIGIRMEGKQISVINGVILRGELLKKFLLHMENLEPSFEISSATSTELSIENKIQLILKLIDETQLLDHSDSALRSQDLEIAYKLIFEDRIQTYLTLHAPALKRTLIEKFIAIFKFHPDVSVRLDTVDIMARIMKRELGISTEAAQVSVPLERVDWAQSLSFIALRSAITDDNDHRVRLRSLNRLAQIAPQSILGALCMCAEKENEPLVRRSAIWVIGQVGNSTQVALLKKVAEQTQNEKIKRQAQLAIQAIENRKERAPQTLAQATEDIQQKVLFPNGRERIRFQENVEIWSHQLAQIFYRELFEEGDRTPQKILWIVRRTFGFSSLEVEHVKVFELAEQFLRECEKCDWSEKVFFPMVRNFTEKILVRISQRS